MFHLKLFQILASVSVYGFFINLKRIIAACDFSPSSFTLKRSIPLHLTKLVFQLEDFISSHNFSKTAGDEKHLHPGDRKEPYLLLLEGKKT